ncbi:MAG TPA: creatininase family protein, partial [Nitrososphaera sp.]|nr:creatininase family protein [Nitrososphaera sp.]
MSIPVFGMSDPDFRIALRKTRRAIIPIGSLEQHGAHLPVSTDSLISEYIARMLAERTKSFVLPVMTFGVSFEHRPMFNVSVKHGSLTNLLSDACESLAENGIGQIILLNGHHGNMGALQYVSQQVSAAGGSATRTNSAHTKPPTRVHAIHYWQVLDHE